MTATTSGDPTITETFEYVFFEGQGGVSADSPFPWPIAIDGRGFAIDLSKSAWEIPDMVRQAIDFSARPGEQSFDTGGVWLRSSGDWSLGSNQRYLDADYSSTRRFFSSLGVDPWTRRELALQPDTERFITSAGTVLQLLPHGAYLYVMEGAARTLKRTTNPEAASPTLTTITGGPANDFIDTATDGNQIYLATNGSGLYKHDVSAGTTMTSMGGDAATLTANVIEYANGWLLAGAANVLYSISAAGAKTVVRTNPNTAFVWSAIVGAPNAIYAAGQSDDVGEIYRIGIDDTTGGLATPIFAGSVNRGESIRSLDYYGGVLIVGTSKGLHVAEINADSSLTLGPLVNIGTDVFAIAPDDHYAWFGWSNYDGSHTGCGRVDLAQFTEKDLPAYATDVMAATTGAVLSVARFVGRTYFAVSASGFWHEEHSGNLVASGRIQLGKLEWTTFEPKMFLGVELITEPLDGEVAADVTDDVGTVTTLGSLTTAGGTGLGTFLGTGQAGLSTCFDVGLTLTRDADDATAGPVVRLLSARALVVPRQIQRWTLAIICKEKVDIGAGGDVEKSQDVAAVHDFFVQLRKAAAPVVYQVGRSQSFVIVRGVAFPQGAMERWGRNRDGIEGLLMVTLDQVSS